MYLCNCVVAAAAQHQEGCCYYPTVPLFDYLYRRRATERIHHLARFQYQFLSLDGEVGASRGGAGGGGGAPPVTTVSFSPCAFASVSSFHRQEDVRVPRKLIPNPQDGKFLCVVVSATQRGWRGWGRGRGGGYWPLRALTGLQLRF